MRISAGFSVLDSGEKNRILWHNAIRARAFAGGTGFLPTPSHHLAQLALGQLNQRYEAKAAAAILKRLKEKSISSFVASCSPVRSVAPLRPKGRESADTAVVK